MKLVSKLSIKNNFRVLLKQIYIPLLSLVLFSNCSSTLMLHGSKNYDDKLEKLNDLGSKYSSEIYLIDNTSFSCSDLKVSRDSVYFLNVMDSTNVQLPLEQIATINIYNTSHKVIGGLAGGLISGAISLALIDTECGSCHPFNAKPLMIGGTAGSFGFLLGFLLSGDEEFIFYEFEE